jgi:hypothetical protein
MSERRCLRIVDRKRCPRNALEGSNYCRLHQLHVGALPHKASVVRRRMMKKARVMRKKK